MAEVSIECYKTDSAPGTNSGKSYTYDNWLGTNNTVVDGDKNTVLKSLLGSGLDMDADYPSSSDGAATTTMEVVPGLSGGGPGTNGQAAGDAQGGAGSGGVDSSAPQDGGSAECNDGFSQDCTVGSGGSSSSKPENQGARQEHVLGTSAFAALIAVAGMLWL